LKLCFIWAIGVHNPNGKSSAILHSSWHSVVGHVLSLNNCPFVWTIWAHLIMLSWAHQVHNPNLDQFSHFCTDHGIVTILYNGLPLPPLKIKPSHGGSRPHLTRFLGKRHPDRLAVFAQTTTECPYILQWDAPFRLEISPSHGGSGHPINIWFLGPTQVLNPNSISIGSAVFVGLTSVTDRPTDRQTMLLSR